MSNDGLGISQQGAEVAQALASLFGRLGFAAIIRHPETADIIATTPDAENLARLAAPGCTRIAAGRIGGELVRVELIPALEDGPVHLTRRQQDVARLLAEGLRNREIAERLGISTHTVRRHMEAILSRLSVSNRAAAAKALRNGRANGIGTKP